MASVFFLGPLEVGGNLAIKRQRRTNTWPANGREERSVAPSGKNHCFTAKLVKNQGSELSALCATTARSGVRAAHPFSYPPPLRGGGPYLARYLDHYEIGGWVFEKKQITSSAQVW